MIAVPGGRVVLVGCQVKLAIVSRSDKTIIAVHPRVDYMVSTGAEVPCLPTSPEKYEVR